MTTTITTVGFGDYKGFNTGDIYQDEMIWLYWVTILGITLFSSITSEIFSYRKLKTVKEIVSERTNAIEKFLYEVSKANKEQNLENEIYETTIEFVREATKHSTIHYLGDNAYF